MGSERTQLLIRFGYDGARFAGLQPQGPTVPTAGGALKVRLAAAAGVSVRGLNFAARTDAGVHALTNLATCFFRDLPVPVDAVLQAVCAPRGDGLLGVRAEVVPTSVHARGSAVGKRYRYLLEDRSRAPRAAHGVWAVAPELSAERLCAAAALLQGTHDFSSLRGGGCSAKSTVKHMASIRVGGPLPLDDDDGGPRRFIVEICGDAFLRKMVRNMIGLLVEIGAGLRSPDDVPALLAARDRTQAGMMVAPAAGLCLVEVGCRWPADGSRLIAELRASAEKAPEHHTEDDGDEHGGDDHGSHGG